MEIEQMTNQPSISSRHAFLILLSCFALGCADPPSGMARDMGGQTDDMEVSPDRLVLLVDEAPAGDLPLEVEKDYAFGLRALDANGAELDTSSAILEFIDLDMGGMPLPGPALTVRYDGERIFANEVGRVRVVARFNGLREELELTVAPRNERLNEPMPLTVLRQGIQLDAGLLLATRTEVEGSPVEIDPLLASNLCATQEKEVEGVISLDANGEQLTPEYPGVGKIAIDCTSFAMFNGGERARDYHFKVLPPISVSAGKHQTCAVRGSGGEASLRCWGRNDMGQLGTDVRADAPVPVEVPEIVAPLDVDLATDHACVVDEIGDISCWGDNTHGRVSAQGAEGLLGPTKFSHPRLNFVGVCATDSTTCGLSERGRLICWGTNNSGLLGTSLNVGARVEHHIEPFPTRRFATVACGSAHMCGTTFDGKSVCWGSNERGQLGAGIDDPVSGQPLEISSPIPGTKFGTFSLGEESSCGVTYKGDLYCWGDNSKKQLSSAVVNDFTNIPTLYRGIHGGDGAEIPLVSEVALGDAHTCVTLRDGGGLRCWGSNTYGQLATTPDKTIEDVSNPTNSFLNYSMTAIAAGDRHTCGFDGNQLLCWGDKANGRLGQGGGEVGIVAFNAMAPSFNDFAADFSAQDISLGERHGCVILSPGPGSPQQVQCWGSNDHNQVNIVDGFDPVLSVGERGPRQIVWNDKEVRPYVSIAAGARHSCLLAGQREVAAQTAPDEYDAVFCWGDSEYGQAGPSSALEFKITAPPSSGGMSREDEMNLPWGGLGDSLAETSSCAIGAFEQDPNGRGDFPGVNPNLPVFEGGRVVCWGRGALGELGAGSNELSDQQLPSTLTDVPNTNRPLLREVVGVKQLQCGWENAATVASRVYCWGRDPSGMMKDWGDVEVEERGWFKPTAVFDPRGTGGTIEDQFGIRAMGLGLSHGCAIRVKPSGTSLICWGENERGQLGKPDAEKVIMRNYEILESIGEPLYVAVGYNHTCASNKKNEIYCWGDNRFGQSGATDPTVGVLPNSHVVRMPNKLFDGATAEVRDLVAGANNTCALLAPKNDPNAKATVHCWGENSTGQSQWKGANSWSRSAEPRSVAWQ